LKFQFIKITKFIIFKTYEFSLHKLKYEIYSNFLINLFNYIIFYNAWYLKGMHVYIFVIIIYITMWGDDWMVKALGCGKKGEVSNPILNVLWS